MKSVHGGNSEARTAPFVVVFRLRRAAELPLLAVVRSGRSPGTGEFGSPYSLATVAIATGRMASEESEVNTPKVVITRLGG